MSQFLTDIVHTKSLSLRHKLKAHAHKQDIRFPHALVSTVCEHVHGACSLVSSKLAALKLAQSFLTFPQPSCCVLSRRMPTPCQCLLQVCCTSEVLQNTPPSEYPWGSVNISATEHLIRPISSSSVIRPCTRNWHLL